MDDDKGTGGQQPADAGQQQTGQDTGQQFDLNAFLRDGWRQHIPEELRTSGVVSKVASLEELARSAAHAEKHLGKDPTRLTELPEAGSEQEPQQRLAVLRQLGAPEKAEEYKLPDASKLEGAPEGFEPNNELTEWLKSTSAELGLLPDQAAKLYEGFMSKVFASAKAETEAVQQSQQEAAEKLKQEFGDAYESRMSAFKRAVGQMGEGFAEKVQQSGLSLDPNFVTQLAKLEPALRGDQGMEGMGGRSHDIGVTPAEARDRADALTRESMEAFQKGETARARNLQEQALKMRERSYNSA